MYIILSKRNGYIDIEDKNGSKCLTLIPIDENKDMLKSMKKYGTLR